MKNITAKQFQILTDMQLVWDFMVDSYEHFFINGVAAPFFEYAITSSWMNKSYLHLNRLWLDQGKVVGFVFAEENMPNFNNEQELVLFYGQNAFVDVVKKRICVNV